jgi:hypothetical protein
MSLSIMFGTTVLAFASEFEAFLRLPWIDGGFDSEIVATTLNDPRHDEYDDARTVSNRAVMSLHRVDVEDRQVPEVIERVIFDHEIVLGFPRTRARMLYRAMRAMVFASA